MFSFRFDLEPFDLASVYVLSAFKWIGVTVFAVREAFPPASMCLADVAWYFSAVSVNALASVAEIITAVGATASVFAVPAIFVIA